MSLVPSTDPPRGCVSATQVFASSGSGGGAPLFSPIDLSQKSQESDGGASVSQQPQLAQPPPKRRRRVTDPACAVYTDLATRQIELWFMAAPLVPDGHAMAIEFRTPQDEGTVRVTCQRSATFPGSDWTSLSVTTTADVVGPARQLVLVVPPLAPCLVPLGSRYHVTTLDLPGPARPAAHGIASALVVAVARDGDGDPVPVADLAAHSADITNVNTARLLGAMGLATTTGWGFAEAGPGVVEPSPTS